jgi:hypothetical protein
MVNTASAEVDVHGLPRSRLPAVGSRRRAHVARSWGRPGHRSVPVRSSLSPGSSVRWGTVSASGATTPGPVTPSTSPLRFTGGPIEKVVVDASGERYVDHAAQVRGALLLDATGHAPDTCAGTATGDPGLAAPRRCPPNLAGWTCTSCSPRSPTPSRSHGCSASPSPTATSSWSPWRGSAGEPAVAVAPVSEDTATGTLSLQNRFGR